MIGRHPIIDGDIREHAKLLDVGAAHRIKRSVIEIGYDSSGARRFLNSLLVPPPISWKDWLEQHKALDWLYPGNTLSAQVASAPWAPVAADSEAAWQFLVELRSRVATQPLAFRSGTEDAALQSMASVFETFRNVAKEYPKASHFTVLMLQLLNTHVRPFTARWHRLKEEGRLSSVDFRVKFRTELTAVQKLLRQGTEILAELAEVPLLGYPDPPPPQTNQPYIDDPLPLATAEQEDRWKPVFQAELTAIQRRRTLLLPSPPAELTSKSESKPESESGSASIIDGIGLALSGGGIRSATFSLGVITVLARQGILKQVDYLSTVSGGGYLGAFISSAVGHAKGVAAIEQLFGAKGEPESQGPRALRDHSKYLIEGGIRTAATIAGLVTYGLATTLLLVAPAVLLLAALIRFVPPNLSWWALVIPAAVSLVGYLTTAIAQRFRCTQIENAGIWIGVVSLGLLLLAFAWYYNLENLEVSIQLTGWIAISIGVASFALFVPSLAKPVKQIFGVLIAALMFALAWLCITWLAALPHTRLVTELLIGASLVTFVVTNLTIDLNAASPQRYYRDRLAKTYLLTVNSGVKPNPNEKLTGLNPSGYAPYHLINATLNIPGSRNPDLRGRRSDFFLFSKYYCGSPSSGIHLTDTWEGADSHLDLATAVATSGAAAAPNMGTNKASRFRYLLAMLNLRLGYWLRNPMKSSRFGLNPSRYFWHELRGDMSEELPYLNLSDGGHLENLGIYELLRRRCKFIIAVDGEADPERSFGGLLTLRKRLPINPGCMTLLPQAFEPLPIIVLSSGDTYGKSMLRGCNGCQTAFP